MRLRQRPAEHPRRRLHHRVTGATIHDERGHLDGSGPIVGDAAILAEEGDVVIGERRCDRLHRWPEGRMTHPRDLLVGRPHILHEQRDGISAATRGQRFGEPPDVRVPCRPGFGVFMVRGVVQGNLRDFRAECRRRFEGKGSTRRMTVEGRRSASRGDQCVKVLDLARDRIGLRIPAVAATTAVIVVDRELRREAPGEVRPRPR
jgi:hypothetical protein